MTSLVLDVNGLSIRMAHSLRKTPTCEGRGGRLPSCRDSCSTRSLQRRNGWRPQHHSFWRPTASRSELDHQRQDRDHGADESDGPDKLLQQGLISVNGIRRGFEGPVLPGVHRAAQLLKAGMTYQAKKARMARTMTTIAEYLIAAYPARPDDSGSGLWV